MSCHSQNILRIIKVGYKKSSECLGALDSGNADRLKQYNPIGEYAKKVDFRASRDGKMVLIDLGGL